jgi:hypothetical protein
MTFRRSRRRLRRRRAIQAQRRVAPSGWPRRPRAVAADRGSTSATRRIGGDGQALLDRTALAPWWKRSGRVRAELDVAALLRRDPTPRVYLAGTIRSRCSPAPCSTLRGHPERPPRVLVYALRAASPWIAAKGAQRSRRKFGASRAPGDRTLPGNTGLISRAFDSLALPGRTPAARQAVALCRHALEWTPLPNSPFARDFLARRWRAGRPPHLGLAAWRDERHAGPAAVSRDEPAPRNEEDRHAVLSRSANPRRTPPRCFLGARLPGRTFRHSRSVGPPRQLLTEDGDPARAGSPRLVLGGAGRRLR